MGANLSQLAGQGNNQLPTPEIRLYSCYRMTNSLSEKILSSAREVFGASVTLRRQLHRIPETAWQEHKTSTALKRFLKSHRIPFKSLVDTGIVAEIKSGRGKCVAIRTDIDALPITEQTDYSFSSTHPGRMHACGHDIHMATVSTAALLLNQLRNEFSGTVKLLYQPAEESAPGGAIAMVKAGVLQNPKVNMIFGLHAWPTIKAGQVAVKDGALCAGVLDFDIEIIGKGGHGAYPHDTVDPIVCCSHIVSSLQTIVSRSVNPFEPAVVTIGKIEGGAARNVISPTCKLYGTARAQSERQLRQLQRKIEVIVHGGARTFNCKGKITYLEGYPPLVNAPEANKYLVSATQKLYGKRALVSLPHPSMGGEDFAYFLRQVPGAMFLLGVRNLDIGAVYGLHHPKFRADENAITVGTAILTQAAIDYLNE
jgi:amidohydrolase